MFLHGCDRGIFWLAFIFIFIFLVPIEYTLYRLM